MNSVRNVTPAKKPKYIPEKIGIVLNYSNFDDDGKTPAAMVEKDEVPLFRRHLDLIAKRFERDHISIVAVCGNTNLKILDKLPQELIIIENDRYKELGDARSIGIGIRALNCPKILVIEPTSLINEENLNFNVSKSTIVISKDKPNKICANYDEKTLQIELLMYGLKFGYCKINLFTAKELEILKSICFDEFKYKLQTFELVNEIIKQNGSFVAFKHN